MSKSYYFRHWTNEFEKVTKQLLYLQRQALACAQQVIELHRGLMNLVETNLELMETDGE